MPRSKYQVITALFDIIPVNEAGEINVEKISNVEPLLNLGRKLRIGKSGQPVLSKQSRVKNQELRITNKPESQVGREENGLEDLNSKFLINDSVENPAEDLEKYLNEDINPA